MAESATESILDRIAQAENLPALPAVAVRVLRLIQQEDVAVTEIAAAIEQDAALSAKILKVVNSALFGMPHNVSSLPQAMVVLGLRTLKVMVLSFSMVNELGNCLDDGFDHELYWRRSITTAVCSRLLAEKCDPGARDEAFVAGLLADLGILAAYKCAKSEYQPVLEEYKQHRRGLCEIEQERLGVTHAEFSAALLRAWKLPGGLETAARHHHDPVAPPADQDGHYLSRLVWAAARVSDLFCADTPLTELDSAKHSIAESLNETVRSGGMALSSEDVDTILDQVDEHVRRTAEQISLEIGTTTSYGELQAAAMAQLARLSVSAELDLASASRAAEQAQEKIATLSNEKKALAHEAMTDELTQLANRKAFNEKLAEAVASATNTGRSVGLIMLDLDHFKRFNDKYGHLFGDEVLKAVGQMLKKVNDRTHLAARYGGEEFAIIFFDSTLKQLASVAETVRQETEGIELTYGTKKIHITASLGAAQTDPARSNPTAEALIEEADQCLLGAKQAGRNRAIIAT